MLRSLAKRTIPGAVLLAEALVFFRQVLFRDGYVIPWDFRYYHLPQAEFVARAFRAGELPLWDPYYYCGFPLYANLTAQVFYPPTIIATLLSNWAGGDSLAYFLEWQLVLHVFLGGLFTYLMLRRLGAGTAAALAGAAVFQLGAYFASQTQHLGAMNAAAWLPLAWMSVLELARRFSPRWTAAMALSIAMSILAGFPAVTFVVAASSGLLLLLTGATRLRAWLGFGGALIWGVALAGVQVLPTAELTGLSVAKYRYEFMGTGGGLPLQSLVSLVLPGHYGNFDAATYSHPWNLTFLHAYCGLTGLALAAVGAVRSRKAFALMLLLSALWMLGDATPLGVGMFAVLPKTLKASIYPEFALASFTLAMALLAGLGAQRLLRSRGAWAGVLVVAAVASDLTAVSSGRPMNTASLEREPGLTETSFDGSTLVLDKMRALTRRSLPPGRIDTVNDSMHWAMGTSLTRVPSANGNDPFALIRLMQVRLCFTGGRRWGRYYEVSRIDSPVLDLLNVRYLLTRTPIGTATLAKAGFVEAAELPGRVVYENREALPRFFAVDRVEQAGSMEEAVRLLRSPDFHPREAAVVEADSHFAPSSGAAEARVQVLEYKARRIRLETNSPAPAFWVTSEAWYPGWRAWVDDAETPLVLTNAAFRGLPLSAGRHTVVMEFRPRILWYGAAVSAAGWMGLLGLLFARGRKPWTSSSN